MADDGTIRYDVEGHVARVTIDRPERRNAPTWGLVADLRAAFAGARADAGVRVCVLTGAGDRAFRDVDTSLRIVHPLLGVTAATEDAAEGLAAFRDKRPPQWTGR